MCDFKSTQWSAAMSLKASTFNEQLHRLISILGRKVWTVTEELMCYAGTLTMYCTYSSGIAPVLKPSIKNIHYDKMNNITN